MLKIGRRNRKGSKLKNFIKKKKRTLEPWNMTILNEKSWKWNIKTGKDGFRNWQTTELKQSQKKQKKLSDHKEQKFRPRWAFSAQNSETRMQKS